eukprot:TRINITY_DN9129_c0_g4_i1.p1 TRINITY_DN9129_c0_g4~~TRINITY_DN9129_c0_g4_i1.p1  ORF type:complete len:470 (+),score=100.72 TRINITY_DN9129_c0_g4_i1:558-1967(+)
MEAFINALNERKEEFDKKVRGQSEGSVRTPTRKAPDPPPPDEPLIVPGIGKPQEARPSTPPRKLRPGLAMVQSGADSALEEQWAAYQPVVHTASPPLPSSVPSSLGRPGQGPGGQGITPPRVGSVPAVQHSGSRSPTGSATPTREDPMREIKWQTEETVDTQSPLSVGDVISGLVTQQREIQEQQEAIQRKIELAIQHQQQQQQFQQYPPQQQQYAATPNNERGDVLGFSPAHFDTTISPITQGHSDDGSRRRTRTPPAPPTAPRDTSPRLHTSPRIREDIYETAGADVQVPVMKIDDGDDDDSTRWPERQQIINKGQERARKHLQGCRKAYWSRMHTRVHSLSQSPSSPASSKPVHEEREAPSAAERTGSIRALTEELAKDRRLLRATVQELGAIVEAHKITLAIDETEAWHQTNERRQRSESASRRAASPRGTNKKVFASELSRRLQKIHSQSVSPARRRKETKVPS